MSRNVPSRQVDPSNKIVGKVVDCIREEVKRRYGSELTFEQRRDAAVAVTNDSLWLDEERDLQSLVTRADEVEVEGKRYRRLEQPSSAEYRGRWGAHHVEEPLYRLEGVHNGPTIKPVELHAGVVENMTPDLARIVGELSAEQTSRQVVATLRTVGLEPASRAPLEKHEEAARIAEALPKGVFAISCGMDRGAVRMVEALDPATAAPTQRSEPYERTPPPPSKRQYRMAWNGSTTLYDVFGKALHTFRYAAEADSDPSAIAKRVSADVAWVLRSYPGSDVHCIQDGALDLRVLPDMLAKVLPANSNVDVVDLVDFKHLTGYLDDVVDACEPQDDPNDLKGWYRAELLRDDGAIDRIWRKLRDQGESLPSGARKKRKAVAAALSYIRTRKARMRYASHYRKGLPIGSGDTENTVWLMQQRVKRPAQSWRPPGLRGVLVLRSLVLSERWDAAWEAYAATHRKDVRCAA